MSSQLDPFEQRLCLVLMGIVCMVLLSHMDDRDTALLLTFGTILIAVVFFWIVRFILGTVRFFRGLASKVYTVTLDGKGFYLSAFPRVLFRWDEISQVYMVQEAPFLASVFRRSQGLGELCIVLYDETHTVFYAQNSMNMRGDGRQAHSLHIKLVRDAKNIARTIQMGLLRHDAEDMAADFNAAFKGPEDTRVANLHKFFDKYLDALDSHDLDESISYREVWELFEDVSGCDGLAAYRTVANPEVSWFTWDEHKSLEQTSERPLIYGHNKNKGSI